MRGLRRLFLFVLLASAALTLAVVQGVTRAAPEQTFFVGFTEDLPKEPGSAVAAPAAELGASAFRITLMWAAGQTRLAAEDAEKLDRAVRATRGMRIVLAVYSWPGSGQIPLDAAARDQYCRYTANVLRRYRSIRDVVIWNEPNKSLFWSPQLTGDPAGAAPVAYEALLARCWDVLHAARSDVNVIGFALSSTGDDDTRSHSPGNFIRLVGNAYRATGRTRPILDTVGHHPYGIDGSERPWRRHVGSKTIALGDWNKLMYNLWLAFHGTGQPIPGEADVSLWYLEYGVETAVDPARKGAYWSVERAAVIPDRAAGARDQSAQVLDAIRLAACQPFIGAIFNFLLVDEPTLGGWQSGAYWVDRTPKDSLPAFRQAIAEANAGSVDCDALEGGRPSSDYFPPTAPRDVRATPTGGLMWAAAADDSGIAAYRVYRDGAEIGETTETVWSEETVPGASYSVRALDAAGNLGTPAGPS